MWEIGVDLTVTDHLITHVFWGLLHHRSKQYKLCMAEMGVHWNPFPESEGWVDLRYWSSHYELHYITSCSYLLAWVKCEWNIHVCSMYMLNWNAYELLKKIKTLMKISSFLNVKGKDPYEYIFIFCFVERFLEHSNPWDIILTHHCSS